MISITIYNLLGIAVMGNMIAYDFTPIQPAKHSFIKLLPSILSSILDKLLNCSKCVSFWLGFIIYVDILHAAVAGCLGFIINFIYDYISNWYET